MDNCKHFVREKHKNNVITSTHLYQVGPDIEVVTLYRNKLEKTNCATNVILIHVAIKITKTVQSTCITGSIYML